MASLAPGNGWFPHPAYDARRTEHAVRKQAINPGGPGGNVYEFPPVGPAAAPRARAGASVIGKIAALLVAEATHAGRGTAWALMWCIFALALSSMVWLVLAGGLFAAALTIGVPWTAAVIAVGATHLLAAALAVLVAVRTGKRIA